MVKSDLLHASIPWLVQEVESDAAVMWNLKVECQEEKNHSS